ncbi:MAG: A/G-specific adenine glycosylase [Dermatophilaceae bacterium]
MAPAAVDPAVVDPAVVGAAALALLHDRVPRWYAANHRPLPWRHPTVTPWGVLVSEVMSHQTPVARVAPVWQEWMTCWPMPGDLAAEPPGDVVRAWGRLGYPRRALRLREAAITIVERHDGVVPGEEAALRALPGVGAYTAAAVAAFAFGRRTVVVDTNVRRVLARVLEGRAQAAPTLTAREAALASSVLPDSDAQAAAWNAAVMELGALVCRARGPRCGDCPVRDRCAWVAAGSPPDDGPRRRSQAWHGTDRQVRGAVLQLLREGAGPRARAELERAAVTATDAAQVDRCLASLVEDGLLEPLDGGARYRLPV